jgi:MYXO-CTERM domain-containing protein
MKRLVACFCFAFVLTPGAASAQSKLLLQEIYASPNEAEAVAIVNPGAAAVTLSDYYLADFSAYYQVVISAAAPASDFLVRFPAGATIAPGEKQYVSLAGAECFRTACGTSGAYSGFGIYPSYEFPTATMANKSDSVPDMLAPFTGAISGSPGLTNSGEPVVLFYWDGASDLVVDIDYVYFGAGTASNPPVNKTGVSIDGPDADSIASSYAPDSNDVVGHHAPIPSTGVLATCRVSDNEAQIASGSNGLNGTDETSENWSITFAVCSVPVLDGGVDAGLDAGVDASVGGSAGAIGGAAGAATGGTAGTGTGGTTGSAMGGAAGDAGAAGAGTAGGGGSAGTATGGSAGVTGGGGGGIGGAAGGSADAGDDAGIGFGSSGGGCGCATVGEPSSSRSLAVGLLVALGLLARRRRAHL